MANIIFILFFSLGLFAFLAWGFCSLTQEKWQMAFVAPIKKLDDSQGWKGVNYTYYGLFQAAAFAVSASLFYTLLSALETPFSVFNLLCLIGLIIAICLPAARILARLVEKKSGTLTVGGAFFAGILAAPWLVVALNRYTGSGMPVMPFLAAGIAAYSIGEGLGRLACISFGCCYGKSVDLLHPALQTIFHRCNFVFQGTTKKASYEGGLEGKAIVPIQALSSVVLVTTGLVCTYLFLNASFYTAFLVGVFCTQGWRFFSEIFRADYRGGKRISAYQIMAIIAIFYAFFLVLLFPSEKAFGADIMKGLHALWSPLLILIIQALGVTIFLFTGKSRVTGSAVLFHVNREHI